MTSGVGATLTYDEANRMITAQEVSGGKEYYGYDAANKRVYRVTSSRQEQITFYGAFGEKLGVYGIQAGTCNYYYINPSPCVSGFTPLSTSIWFGGRLIMDSGNEVVEDRLGTNRVSGARFYPFGDEITSTTNDREKFGTYTRDSYTGLDYADQRFYASTYGRFNTPDPKRRSAHARNPGSWNRYAYTLGDPVNGNDPTGLDDVGGYYSQGNIALECAIYDINNICQTIGASMAGSGGYLENSYPSDVYDSDDPAVFTADAYGLPPGSDIAANDTAAGIITQVGQNMGGFNTVLGAFAGGSVAAPFVTAGAAGIFGAVGATAGAAATAAAGAATTPEGQEVIDSGSNVWRLFGGTSPGMGNYWATVDPTTISNYANAAGLPPGNTGRFIVQGVLNDMTGVEVSEAPGIGTNLGGLRQVFVPNPACQITVICVGGLNPPLVPHR